MKKLLSILACMVMLSGCAALKTTADKICNPTAAQQTAADQMLTAIDQAQALVAEFVPVANIVSASTLLKEIRAGGCFLISELKSVFDTVDKANNLIKTAENRKLMKAGKAPQAIVLPQYEVLRMYVK